MPAGCINRQLLHHIKRLHRVCAAVELIDLAFALPRLELPKSAPWKTPSAGVERQNKKACLAWQNRAVALDLILSKCSMHYAAVTLQPSHWRQFDTISSVFSQCSGQKAACLMCAGYYLNSCYAFRICTIVRKQFNSRISPDNRRGWCCLIYALRCFLFTPACSAGEEALRGNSWRGRALRCVMCLCKPALSMCSGICLGVTWCTHTQMRRCALIP